VLLGCAFLAKYLAVLLVPAIVLHALYRRRENWATGLILIAAGALPGLGLTLAWNALNCWTNFNVILPRINPDPTVLSLLPLSGFLVRGTLYLTPWVTWLIVTAWRRASSVPYADGRWLGLAALGGLVIYGLTREPPSPWLAPFFPLVFPTLAALPNRTLRKALWANIAVCASLGGAAAVFAAGFAGVVSFRSDWLFSYDVILALDARALCEQMERFADGPAELGTSIYHQANTLAIGCRRQIHVLGYNGLYGRAYDMFSDYRQLDGKTIVMIDQAPIAADVAGGALTRPQYREFQQRGRSFYLIKGTFSYPRFRDTILTIAADRAYGCVLGLPGRCAFRERYFPNSPRCGPVQ
jgi:hypothetical protein